MSNPNQPTPTTAERQERMTARDFWDKVWHPNAIATRRWVYRSMAAIDAIDFAKAYAASLSQPSVLSEERGTSALRVALHLCLEWVDRDVCGQPCKHEDCREIRQIIQLSQEALAQSSSLPESKSTQDESVASAQPDEDDELAQAFDAVSRNLHGGTIKTRVIGWEPKHQNCAECEKLRRPISQPTVQGAEEFYNANFGKMPILPSTSPAVFKFAEAYAADQLRSVTADKNKLAEQILDSVTNYCDVPDSAMKRIRRELVEKGLLTEKAKPTP